MGERQLCCQSCRFHSAKIREHDKENDYSFEKIEQLYYFEHYADHIQAQNERNEKTRHTERNRTVTDLLTNNKTCPEESGDTVLHNYFCSQKRAFHGYVEYPRQDVMPSLRCVHECRIFLPFLQKILLQSITQSRQEKRQEQQPQTDL